MFLGFLAGLAGALIGWVLLNGYFWARLQNIERQVNKAWATNTGARGITAREEIDAEWNAALAEASQILADPAIKGADGKIDVLQAGARLAQLPIKYPKTGKTILKELKKAAPALDGI